MGAMPARTRPLQDVVQPALLGLVVLCGYRSVAEVQHSLAVSLHLTEHRIGQACVCSYTIPSMGLWLDSHSEA
jgi:hypothetical protein